MTPPLRLAKPLGIVYAEGERIGEIMHEQFARLTSAWLGRAYVFTGSIGPVFHDFRYRLEQDGKKRIIRAAAYSRQCYELAADRVEREFAWDDEGVEELKQWLQAQYEAFAAQENGGGI